MPTHDRESSPVPAGEFAFSWSDFHKIAALVHGEAGIVLVESKANLVYSRLAKRLRAIGLRSFRDYCALVESDDGIDERQALIAAMTTNVTKFFREPHHFEHLTKNVLPGLAAAARGGERVRIWSAGCSSGEEPYSIALTLLGVMPDAAEHDVLILATDIDPNMIARGEEAVYPLARLDDIPRSMRGSALEVDTARSCFRFTGRARDVVRFRQLNLLHNWPLKAQFQAVFCRNVMIYFDQATQDDIWRRFAGRMSPGAHLYIGHSERIATDALPFTVAGQTTYRLSGRTR
ncbi:MAG TPA: protein-glutamate O-methyltransferase CheR [Rhizomicrobium sp.]|nr:protein-glutamate O-methyltransferase CheR [Rhizomicrobium sp.]